MADRQLAGFGIPEEKMTQLTIPVGTMAGDVPLSLSVLVFRGKKEGPCLLLTAGIHGDEINGTEIIRQLMDDQSLLPICGMVIAIPVVNSSGFMFRSRMVMPDNKDLNRCFPGSAQGTLASRLAHVLSQQILPHADVCIDFHTGSDRMENHPQLCGIFTNPYAKELVNAFGAPFVVPVEPIDFSWRKEGIKAGKTIFTYEGGEAMRLDSFAIEQGKAGVRRVMQYLNMTHAQPIQTSASVWIKNPVWLRAREAGIFQPYVTCGAKVRKNDLLGCISQPLSTTQFAIKSPQDGYLLSLQRGAVVNAGDALIQLGK